MVAHLTPSWAFIWTAGDSGFPFGAAHDLDPAIAKGLSILTDGRQAGDGGAASCRGGFLAALLALHMAEGRGHGSVTFGSLVLA
jgi:hypothetical protein